MKENSFSFQPDQGLMYLIQQITNKPSAEILGFYYDLGKQIFEIGLKNMKTNQREIRKVVEDMYPGTAVPFKMLVKARRGYKENHAHGSVEITFPDNAVYMNREEIEAMMTDLMENSLLGAEHQFPAFTSPPPVAGKMYKKLIEEILRGKKD